MKQHLGAMKRVDEAALAMLSRVDDEALLLLHGENRASGPSVEPATSAAEDSDEGGEASSLLARDHR